MITSESAPLAEAASSLIEQGIRFNRRNDGSISIRIPTTLPVPHPFEYTVRIIEETPQFVFGVVMFGLPLKPRPLVGLAGFLNEIINNLTFFDRPGLQILAVSDWIDQDKIYEQAKDLARACDVLYPLIMHIRLHREWDENLVRLALLPTNRMLHV